MVGSCCRSADGHPFSHPCPQETLAMASNNTEDLSPVPNPAEAAASAFCIGEAPLALRADRRVRSSPLPLSAQSLLQTVLQTTPRCSTLEQAR